MPLFDAGSRPGHDGRVHDRVVTVPNVITLVRLLGLPLFAWLVLGPERLAVAFWVLVVIAATDWIDGYVARRFDQVSRLGRLWDPIVDRVLLAVAGVTLVVAGIVPWWIVAVILVRDALILGGGMALFGGLPPIPVNRTGKFATACLLAGLPAFLVAAIDWPLAAFAEVFAWTLALAGLGAYLAAAGQYAHAAWRLRRVT